MTWLTRSWPAVVGSAVLVLEGLAFAGVGVVFAFGPMTAQESTLLLREIGGFVAVMGALVLLTTYGFARQRRWSFALTITWQLMVVGIAGLVVAALPWLSAVLAVLAVAGLASAIVAARRYYAAREDSVERPEEDSATA